jgi:amidophosphoribosyltransferase
MSTISELFAPKFMEGSEMTPQVEQQMAKSLNADSLRYLPIDSIARSIDLPRNHLCQACIDSNYPTTAGTELYQIALGNEGAPAGTRTYDTTETATTRT